ncbi:hypothetical protein JG687_00013362 [Phytophthora cactorum]|uniref:Chitin-binding type-4 domain-containing protein n=1 Tax=Phytophthora cactorum TaxID=29920 RepID=A0A8T1U1N1_9STRA|nr:hypothetical protein JG687_00013362 [Phytophthora cactorum]
MKPAIFCTLAGTAIMLANTVDAHGQMLVPSYRPITAKYREDCLFGLKGAGDDELQWAPIENLSQRGQADQPVAATFNIYNGCRGLVYESENNVTEIEAGKEFDVKYYIQATHPGYMELSIVKPSTDATGKITYNRDTQIEYFSDFANTAGTFSVTATIPTNVTGCENAGDCALQFYWHSDIANQTDDTATSTTTDASSEGATPTPTNAPEATTAPDATPASDKCSVRRRRLMRQ